MLIWRPKQLAMHSVKKLRLLMLFNRSGFNNPPLLDDF